MSRGVSHFVSSQDHTKGPGSWQLPTTKAIKFVESSRNVSMKGRCLIKDDHKHEEQYLDIAMHKTSDVHYSMS